METVIIRAEINKEDLPFVEKFLNFLKAKSIKIEEKDPTKMTKKEFFERIDKGLKDYENGKIKEFQNFKEFQNYISR